MKRFKITRLGPWCDNKYRIFDRKKTKTFLKDKRLTYKEFNSIEDASHYLKEIRLTYEEFKTRHIT